MTTLKQLAINLEKTAEKYASQDIEAKKLLDSIHNIIDRAKNGDVISTEEKVPGFYWFTEGELSQYKDLEEAYSQFSIFIAAGSDEGYERMLKSVDDAIK